MPKIIVKAECESCGGSGLYQGMAEREGAAVICCTCKGTGCDEIEYVPFTKRKINKDVKRVFKTSCGFAHSAKDHTTKDGVLLEFSKGGCTYPEWLNGEKPKPVKTLYCPYLWEDQDMQNQKHPKYAMYNTRCSLGTNLGSRIPECSFFKSKDRCWEEYEKLDK